MSSIKYSRWIESYAEWLRALNYERLNAECGIRRVADFLNSMNANGLTEPEQINRKHIEQYFEGLGMRINPRTGAALSIHSLKAYSKELNRFARYLHETGQGHLEICTNTVFTQDVNEQGIKDVIYSSDEITRLYAACSDSAAGLRDRAMLSVYYGCGLRRTEGVMLEMSDVQFNRGMLHVRKGKNYKERYVPMTGRVSGDLTEYALTARPELAKQNGCNRFFITSGGLAMGAQSMNICFAKLKAKAHIEKPGNLHALRHSIATHLLQRGMSLEQIARFLGHSCLESTQIYTHVAAL